MTSYTLNPFPIAANRYLYRGGRRERGEGGEREGRGERRGGGRKGRGEGREGERGGEGRGGEGGEGREGKGRGGREGRGGEGREGGADPEMKLELTKQELI